MVVFLLVVALVSKIILPSSGGLWGFVWSNINSIVSVSESNEPLTVSPGGTNIIIIIIIYNMYNNII